MLWLSFKKNLYHRDVRSWVVWHDVWNLFLYRNERAGRLNMDQTRMAVSVITVEAVGE